MREPASPGCVFCELIAGRGEKSVAFEDDLCVVLLDSHPVTEGHSLVIPRRHAVHLRELEDETWAHLCVVAKKVEVAIRAAIPRCEGINLFAADGVAAFQRVRHIHLHVLPRYRGDSFRIEADWSSRPARQELDGLAARLRSGYLEGQDG